MEDWIYMEYTIFVIYRIFMKCTFYWIVMIDVEYI